MGRTRGGADLVKTCGPTYRGFPMGDGSENMWRIKCVLQNNKQLEESLTESATERGAKMHLGTKKDHVKSEKEDHDRPATYSLDLNCARRTRRRRRLETISRGTQCTLTFDSTTATRQHQPSTSQHSLTDHEHVCPTNRKCSELPNRRDQPTNSF